MASDRNGRKTDRNDPLNQEVPVNDVPTEGGAADRDAVSYDPVIQSAVSRVAERASRSELQGAVDREALAAEAERLLSVRVEDFGLPHDSIWKVAPTLAGFLLAGSWDGIQPRSPARLGIQPHSLGFTVTLTCPEEAVAYTADVETTDELLVAFDRLLRAGRCKRRQLKVGPGAQKLRENRKKAVDLKKQKT